MPKEIYDTKMIRCFHEHLLWELHANKLEHQHVSHLDPQVAEQLVKDRKRRGVVTLVPFTRVEGRPGMRHTRSKVSMAENMWHQEMVSLRDSQIDMLEKLEPLFEEALMSAIGIGFAAQTVYVDEVLRSYRNSGRCTDLIKEV